MQAVVIGATGATGKDLLPLLLQDDSFQQVHIFVRSEPNVQHLKLTVHVIDFDKPDTWQNLVQGDVLFSCLGTTLKAAGSQAAQWKIDYEYQYEFAKCAKENGVNHCVLVSSAQASPNAKFFYTRMKGQLETAIKQLQFLKLTIFNPPILIRKNSDRTGEVAGLKIIQLLHKIGLLRSQQPLPTEVLAQAMVNCAKVQEAGTVSIEGNMIWRCADAHTTAKL